jgi:anti-sigma B factor antagonist
MSGERESLDLTVEGVAHAGSEVRAIRARGEVDLSSSEKLSGALEAERDGKPVLLDLSEVSFMDSSGLRVVLVASRELGPKLAAVVDPDSAVARLLEVAEVSDRIQTGSSEDAALALLRPAGDT